MPRGAEAILRGAGACKAIVSARVSPGRKTAIVGHGGRILSPGLTKKENWEVHLALARRRALRRLGISSSTPSISITFHAQKKDHTILPCTIDLGKVREGG